MPIGTIENEIASARSALNWDAGRMAREVNEYRMFSLNRAYFFPSDMNSWENGEAVPSKGASKLLLDTLIRDNDAIGNKDRLEDKYYRVMRARMEAIAAGRESEGYNDKIKAFGDFIIDLRQQGGKSQRDVVDMLNAFVNTDRPEPVLVQREEIRMFENGEEIRKPKKGEGRFGPLLSKDILHILAYHGAMTSERARDLQASYESGGLSAAAQRG